MRRAVVEGAGGRDNLPHAVCSDDLHFHIKHRYSGFFQTDLDVLKRGTLRRNRSASS